MFSKRKKAPFIEVTKLSSLIAEDVQITGDVCFANGMRIDGRVKGNVIGRAAEGPARALLVLSDKGRIEGNVSCADAVINGTVVGDMTIEHFLELQSSAKVTGVIRYEKLQMDVGAAVCGQLQKAAAGPLVHAADNVIELALDQAARK